MLVCSQKNKVVLLISTEHYTCNVDRNKATLKPYQILDYNENKAGVDTMDQMVNGYSCKRATNRWPLAMFFNMLDIAGLASFIIHDELRPKKQTDKRRFFIIELATQLVIPHMEERSLNPNVRRFPYIREAMALFHVNVCITARNKKSSNFNMPIS